MRRGLAALLAAALLVHLAAGAALGERNQIGNIITSLQGTVSPLTLPRDRRVPVAVHLSGSISTADGTILPKVKTMEFALAGRGAIDTHGLPVCPLPLIRHSRDKEALAACGDALVGRGRVDARINILDQPSIPVHASLLAFNGRVADGITAVFLHVYAEKPPISVVIPFVVRHPPGVFGNKLLADLPPGLGPWPSVADFSMTLSRRFSYRGSRHSFLLASCPLPRRFTSGLLSLARLAFTLDGERQISTEIVRTCRAR